MTPRVFTITHPPETFLRSLVVPGESSRSGLSWGPSGLLWRTHAGPGTACALQIQAPDHNYRGELGNRLPSPKQPSATPDNLDDPSTPSTQNPEPTTHLHTYTHTLALALSLSLTHIHTRASTDAPDWILTYMCPRLAGAQSHLGIPQTDFCSPDCTCRLRGRGGTWDPLLAESSWMLLPVRSRI